MADYVIDDGKDLTPAQLAAKSGQQRTARDMSVAGLMSDRNGTPPTPEQMKEMQNRIMGRAPNFDKLPQAEKEKVMFQELQNWHFSQMPSIEEMKADIEKHPLTCEVKSFNEDDVKGYKNQHINLLAGNVSLSVVSDGKTIKFNNAELLEQYRNAVQNKENKENNMSDLQKRGQTSHSSRSFDD